MNIVTSTNQSFKNRRMKDRIPHNYRRHDHHIITESMIIVERKRYKPIRQLQVKLPCQESRP